MRLRQLTAPLRRLWFRLKHGFWPEEWYSLDTALAGWLYPRIRHLAWNGIGSPASYVDQHGEVAAFMAWCDDLRAVASDLEAYSKHWEAETVADEEQAIRAGQDAMLWVAHNFTDLWD